MSRYVEQPACRTAIIQALRFEFGLRVTEIAALVQVPPQTVSMLTVSEDCAVVPWWRREFKREAIEAARRYQERE